MKGNVLGYRMWVIRRGELCPIRQGGNPWEKGLNHAECWIEKFQDVGYPPHEDHHCGFNAFFELSSLLQSGWQQNDWELNVYGAIAGSGDMRIHSEGFRSSEAQPLAFLIPEKTPRKDYETIYDLAKEFEIPVFSPEEKERFKSFVSYFADPIDSYKPEAPAENTSWESIIWPADSVDDQPSVVFADGRKEWRASGKLHRSGGRPAVIDGERQEWWFHGFKHRLDGPAHIEPGVTKWYHHGELHREGGPALVDKNSSLRMWSIHGLNHRTDGPAVELDDGNILEWWEEGRLHRSGGLPAVIRKYPNGTTRKLWYENGKPYRENDLPTSEEPDCLEWRNEFGLHRDGDRPASIRPSQIGWYKNGKNHRDGDRPAFITMGGRRSIDVEHIRKNPDFDFDSLQGSRHWMIDNHHHRDNGKPAVEHLDGTKEFWEHGVRL